MESLMGVVCLVLVVLGVLGSVLPLLPGAVLIVAGTFGHALLLPGEISWWTVGGVVAGYVLTLLVDLLAGAVGGRWFGGSKWGMWGALAGTLVGLFFGPPGWLLGPLGGAFLGELLLDKKKLKTAGWAAAGVTTGLVGGVVVRAALAVGMAGLYVCDLLWW